MTSIINNIGLGIGIGVFLLIALFIMQEYKVDKFIADKERVYRVEMGDWALLGPGFAEMMKEVSPDIVESISIQAYFLHSEMARIDDRLMMLNDYMPVSKNLISFLGFKVIAGDSKNPLDDPYSIVLTQTEAKRLFGNTNPIGRVITIFDKYNFTVTAVIEDPTNFHLSFNALLPFDVLVNVNGWTDISSMLLSNMNNPTYIKLSSNDAHEKVLSELVAYLKNRFDSDEIIEVRLRPVSDVYFKGAIPFEGKVKHGNLRFIGVMSIVGFLILFLACVNYINLSTAKAATRAREIGVRKVVGGSRVSIVFQFLGESVLTVLLALVIGIALLELSSPFFSTLIERYLDTSILLTPEVIFILLFGAIILGVISGLYPAFYLSSYSPVAVLKGQLTKGTKGSLFRKVLIVFQFTVSAGLIVSTLIIFSQLKYFTSYDVGFNKEQIINIRIPRKTSYSYNVFKERMLQIPSVVGMSISNSTMGNIRWQESFYDSEGKNHNYSYIPVDPDFIDLFELEIIEGRNFEWDRPGDVRETIIINETMARMLGYENPIGQKLGGQYTNATVIGIIKDFNFNSLHSSIGPLGLNYRGSAYNTYNIKIETSSIERTLFQIKELWDEYSVESPFEFSFLNESFEENYRSEKRMGMMFGYFAFIAIFIGCMGLFGLSAYILQARVKEMGIRKVLGASTMRIIGIMGREFAMLVLASNAIAWPVAYFAMRSWLEEFPYRAPLSAIYFLTALILSLAIAFITVSYHSWKTARANPVDSLKYE